MRIDLGETTGGSFRRFFHSEDKSLECREIIANYPHCGYLEWREINLEIGGGDRFLKEMKDCDGDVNKLKDLAWSYFIIHLTRQEYTALLATEHKRGLQEGRDEVRIKIRNALGIGDAEDDE